jgi:murein L,D-transpeptidase YcbB/YkuD
MPARVVWFAALSLTLLAATTPKAENIRLRRLVESGKHPAIRWGRFSDVQVDAAAVYRLAHWTPLWLANNRPTATARALVDLLATASDRGLAPEDYDAAQLAALVATMDRRGADDEQAIRFDAALTIALLRFTTALAVGRAPLSERGLPARFAPARFDRAGFVDQLRVATNPDSMLSTLEPGWEPYQALRRALARYRRFAKDSVQRRSYYLGGSQKMALALERWRWLPRGLGGRLVLLSAPSGKLDLFETPGRPVSLRFRTGASCRKRAVSAGEAWMLVLRPADQPGALLRIPVSGDWPLVAPRAGTTGPPGGCVEVNDGELLAQLLLRDRADWPGVRVTATLNGNRQVYVRLRQPLTLLYVYSTAYVSPDGTVQLTPDEFGLDARLAAVLRRGYGG